MITKFYMYTDFGDIMSKSIVLFRSELDTLNAFSEQMKLGFEELGYDIFMFDLTDSVISLGKLYEYLKENNIVAMVGFNIAFFGMQTPSGANVWEQLGILCINILVDHPYWYRDILLKMRGNGLVLCVDGGHMSFVDRFYDNIGMNGFLAHGGTKCTDYIKPISQRGTDILYAGSLYKKYINLQKPDFTRWDFCAEQICEDTIGFLLENTGYTIEEILERELIRRGIVLTDDELCEFISSCVYIERTVSSHFREKIIKTIAESGLDITLYGNGWEDCDWIKLSNVHYEGVISAKDVLVKMQDTKIVLNTMPWFKSGAHERIFNGMLRGCVVVTEESTYINDLFKDDELVTFSLADEDIAKLPYRLKGLLEDDNLSAGIAGKGYNAAIGCHTWQDRAKEIHEFLDCDRNG